MKKEHHICIGEIGQKMFYLNIDTMKGEIYGEEKNEKN